MCIAVRKRKTLQSNSLSTKLPFKLIVKNSERLVLYEISHIATPSE